jgi:hypothetical protein
MNALRAGDLYAAGSQVDWPERWVAPVERRCAVQAEVGQGDYQAQLVVWEDDCSPSLPTSREPPRGIHESVAEGNTTTKVGSIAAGWQYQRLVARYPIAKDRVPL